MVTGIRQDEMESHVNPLRIRASYFFTCKIVPIRLKRMVLKLKQVNECKADVSNQCWL